MSPRRVRTHAAAAVLGTALAMAGCASSQRQPTWVRLERTAESSYRAGNLVGAQAAFEELLKSKPKHTTAHLRLGAIAYQRGNAEQAKQHFENALSTNQKSAQATYNLAMLSLNDASRRLHDYLTIAPAGPTRERVSRMLASLEQFEASK